MSKSCGIFLENFLTKWVRIPDGIEKRAFVMKFHDSTLVRLSWPSRLVLRSSHELKYWKRGIIKRTSWVDNDDANNGAHLIATWLNSSFFSLLAIEKALISSFFMTVVNGANFTTEKKKQAFT